MICEEYKALVNNGVHFANKTSAERMAMCRHNIGCPNCKAWLEDRLAKKGLLFQTREEQEETICEAANLLARDLNLMDPEES